MIYQHENITVKLKKNYNGIINHQRWSRGHKLEAKANGTKKFRGQGQTLSRPRPRTKDTSVSVLKKKRSSKIFFQAISTCEKQKKGLRKFSARFLALSNKISRVRKIVLSSSRGRSNFRGLEASRPRLKTSKSLFEDVLEAKKPRTSSRTSPLLATSHKAR